MKWVENGRKIVVVGSYYSVNVSAILCIEVNGYKIKASITACDPSSEKFLVRLYMTPSSKRIDKTCARSCKTRHRNNCFQWCFGEEQDYCRKGEMKKCLWDPGPSIQSLSFPRECPSASALSRPPPPPETGYSNWVYVQHHDLTLAGAQPAIITTFKKSCNHRTFDKFLNVRRLVC
jgi:hypothetical protein